MCFYRGMTNKIARYRRFRENLIPMIGICLCVYFSYHLILGKRSYQQHLSLSSTIIQQEFVLSVLQDKRYGVETKVKMMRPGSLDYDLLSERIRHVLGYKFADEAVVLSNRG